MDKMFLISLTEQQIKLLYGILESQFQEVCVSYRFAKEMKLDHNVSLAANAISDLSCLMAELELQFITQKDT